MAGWAEDQNQNNKTPLGNIQGFYFIAAAAETVKLELPRSAPGDEHTHCMKPGSDLLKQIAP